MSGSQVKLVAKGLLFTGLIGPCNLICAKAEDPNSDGTPKDSAPPLEQAKEYTTSVFVPRDEQKALDLYLAAGSEGEPLGYFYAAKLLERALCIERNPDRASVLYSKVAEGLVSRGKSELNGEQLFSLSQLHKTGLGGVKANPAQAQECLEQSSALGYSPAMTALGMRRLTGENGSTKQSGVELILEAARAEERTAMMLLSAMDEWGHIPEDEERNVEDAKRKMIRDLARKVEKGDALAMHRLGVLYLGDEKKVRQGVELLKKSAEMGAIQSLLELGAVYAKGTFGIQKDLESSRKYWSIAAERGDCRGEILLETYSE